MRLLPISLFSTITLFSVPISLTLPAVSAPIITKTDSKILIEGLPPGQKVEIPQQVRKSTSLKVDQCGNGTISTSVRPDLIEVDRKIIQIAKLPITEKPVCGKSSILKSEKKQKSYIIGGLTPNKSLAAQLIVTQKKKLKANKCGFATIKRKQRLSGYAEEYIETLYSINGITLSTIPTSKQPEQKRC